MPEAPSLRSALRAHRLVQAAVMVGSVTACLGVFLAWHDPSLMLSLLTVIPGCGL